LLERRQLKPLCRSALTLSLLLVAPPLCFAGRLDRGDPPLELVELGRECPELLFRQGDAIEVGVEVEGGLAQVLQAFHPLVALTQVVEERRSGLDLVGLGVLLGRLAELAQQEQRSSRLIVFPGQPRLGRACPSPAPSTTPSVEPPGSSRPSSLPQLPLLSWLVLLRFGVGWPRLCAGHRHRAELRRRKKEREGDKQGARGRAPPAQD
jgi:hypothetical protein